MGLLNLAESSEEAATIESKTAEFKQAHTQEILKSNKGLLESYFEKEILKSTSPINVGCVAICSPDLAANKFPDLFSEDDDGLVPFPKVKELSPGVFEKDGYLVFAHQFFRRSLSRQNTLNSPFLSELRVAGKRDDISVKIKLDRDLLGISETFQETVELAYWWGPKFDEDLSRITSGVNRHEASKHQRFLTGVNRLETSWYIRDNQQILEMEELRDHETHGKSEESFGCRYVHSIRNLSEDCPSHFDGAIKDYTLEQMIERDGIAINEAGRNQPYTKLWRIDGSIEVPKWKALLTHFFRDNPLVGEYLGAKSESPIEIGQEVEDTEQALIGYQARARFFPDECLVLSVAYHGKDRKHKTSRSIVPLDTVVLGDKRRPFVEFEVLELRKALERSGEKLSIPSDLVYLMFEDENIDFPLIEHYGTDSVASAQESLNALLSLFKAFDCRGENRLVSYSLSVEYPEHMVCLSVLGRVRDILSWHDCSSVEFLPKSRQSMGKWCDDTTQNLKTLFRNAKFDFDISHVLKKSGLFRMQREHLNPDSFELKFDPEGKSIRIFLFPEALSPEVVDSLKAGELNSAPVVWAGVCECGKCLGDYFQCQCSAILDDDCHCIPKDVRILGAFLTTCPA